MPRFDVSVLFVLMLTMVATGILKAAQTTAARQSDDDASFQPIVEAPLPDGFPGYTPVGQIEVKHYPAYRKAETSGKTAFWTLFRHIQQASISMTAPVEMTYQEFGPPVGREQSMAFLYDDKNTGNAGRQGSVEVVDVPAATVVSIGVRGPRTDEAMTHAEQRLNDWLREHSQQYRRTGPVRVMGYNSPFVPRARQFWEVQIPVEANG